MDPHIQAIQELVESETADTVAQWEQLAAEAPSEKSRAFYLSVAEDVRSQPFPWDSPEAKALWRDSKIGVPSKT